jgi:SAM-dependent methyltransferase
MARKTRVLSVIACGAGPAAAIGTLVKKAIDRGWTVQVIATPSALEFFDAAEIEKETGTPVRSQYSKPGAPRSRIPDAIIVAPATFNTVNQWALGIADTYALGVLAEQTGLGIPIVVLPFVSDALASRPQFKRSVKALRAEGVSILLGQNGVPLHPAHGETDVMEHFPWQLALDEASEMTGFGALFKNQILYPERTRGSLIRPPLSPRVNSDAVTAAADRELLRQTFDTVAAQYHEARPSYPDGLYGELIGLARLAPDEDVLLEIGCGSGQATIPLARRGFAITAVELGVALAAEARRNLAGFPRVTVVNADIEAWQPPGVAAFSLVFAATAWHWIDPAVRYLKAWELLRPGGHLALWEAAHVIPDDGDPFFHEIQDVYDEIGEGVPPGTDFAKPDTLADYGAEIEASGLFTDVAIRRFDWEIRYTAEAYIRLLDTFSGHIAMAQWQRRRLYGEIRRRLAQRPDGLVRRHWGAVLHVARKI